MQCNSFDGNRHCFDGLENVNFMESKLPSLKLGDKGVSIRFSYQHLTF